MARTTTGSGVRAVLATGCILAAGTALVAPAAAGAHARHPEQRASVSAPVRLGICDMTVTGTLDSASRLQRFLPAGYRVGTGLLTAGLREVGLLMFWVLECDGVEVPGSTAQGARLSFTTIQIESPERPTSVTTTPRNFDLYAVFAHTDNGSVAVWLRDEGMPMTLVRKIRIDRGDGVSIDVPGRRTGYSLALRPLHPDLVGGVHDHNNVFWHDDGHGTAGTLTLMVPNATDTTCNWLVPICGRAQAAPGSRSAALLGRSRRFVLNVFEHVDLRDATVTTSRRQP